MTGLVVAFVTNDSAAPKATPTAAKLEIDSGTAELLHSFSENIVGILRYDWQDTQDSQAEITQIVANFQYYLLSNVKAELEFVQITTTDSAGVETDNTKGIFQVTLAY